MYNKVEQYKHLLIKIKGEWGRVESKDTFRRFESVDQGYSAEISSETDDIDTHSVEELLTTELHNAAWCNSNTIWLSVKDVERIHRCIQQLSQPKDSTAVVVKAVNDIIEEINLIECEMFHQAHDRRNHCEERLNADWTNEMAWGEKRQYDGEMLALQNLMIEVRRLQDKFNWSVTWKAKPGDVTCNDCRHYTSCSTGDIEGQYFAHGATHNGAKACKHFEPQNR